MTDRYRVTGVIGTSVWDLARAEWQARRQMRQISAFLRKYVPGFERSYVVQSGVTIGVRESHRISGEYQLTSDDIPGERRWDDSCRSGWTGLAVAGRCISGTHEAHSSYRVMPIALATGQAAGVCAALAARPGKAVRDVPVGHVQAELCRL